MQIYNKLIFTKKKPSHVGRLYGIPTIPILVVQWDLKWQSEKTWEGHCNAAESQCPETDRHSLS